MITSQDGIVHVLFISWKWTYFHILIIKKIKEKNQMKISMIKIERYHKSLCIIYSYGCKQKTPYE
jgi:hypothetical protein